MGRLGSRIPSSGLTWEQVKQKLETETDYKIKPYDDDLDGVLNWKALRFPGVRQSVLAEFTDPKILIATSSMLDVYNSADKVEYAAGNISANSKELTIVGGTSTEAGNSWIYWNLPIQATKRVYIVCNLQSVDCKNVCVDMCDADGSSLSNPPDYIFVLIDPSESLYRLKLKKNVGGAETALYVYPDTENEISYGNWNKLEFYWSTELLNNRYIHVWLDNSWVAGYRENSVLTSIYSIRLRVYDNSTTSKQSGKFKGCIVIIYE